MKDKNESNIEKHEVRFEEDQAVWEDSDPMIVSVRKLNG